MDDTLSTPGDSGSATSSAVVDSPSTASPASDPESSSAGTTAQPDQPGSTRGPVPYDRFAEVNQRYQALRWAEEHDPQTVGAQRRFFDWLDTDPVGAHEYITNYLTRAGVLGQQPAKPNGEATKPQPDVVIPETGQRFYSADQAEKLSQWIAEYALNTRLSPIERRLQEYEADRTTSRARLEAQSLLAEAESWPHFKGHEQEILQALETDKRLSLEGAYRRVVMPKLRQLERQAIVSEMQTKPGASTVNPGASSSGDKVDTTKMSWSDLLKREFAKRR